MTDGVFEASEELIFVVRRLQEAFARADRETLLDLLSRESCTLFLGSDDRELFVGRDAIVEYAVSEAEAFSSAPDLSALLARERAASTEGHSVPETRAWRRGPVGWVMERAGRETVAGTAYMMRGTWIFHLELGQWRCVHIHASVGVPNEEILGHAGADFEALAALVTRERPPLPTQRSVDGTVTIAFTDIEASTEIIERLGDRRWMELLHWHDELVIRATESHAGDVVKGQGDGFMLAFPSASGALDAALAIQATSSRGFAEQPVHIRIGVHAGDAVRERSDFFGHTVVVAARVASQATGGEVLATDLVHGLVVGLDRFRFGPPRTLSLRGIDEPVSVRRVFADTAAS